MKKFYSRTAVFVLMLLSLAFFGGCKNQTDPTIEPDFTYSALVVTLDVGNGNSTLIKLPDVTILIDCGSSGDTGNKTVEKLKAYGVSDIDYLILSHMDENHIGAVEKILQSFTVKTAFVPDLPQIVLNEYPLYEAHYNALIGVIGEQNIKKNIIYNTIEIPNGVFMFLSPLDRANQDSSMSKLVSTSTPTEELIDDVSPVIYFSYKGVRFVFSSDAGQSQEQLVLTNDKIGLYDKFFQESDLVNLREVDFYNLSSHGDDKGNTKDFIDHLSAKNLLISVSSENQGCPKTKVLENALSARNDCKFYSTMLVGDICTYILETGEYLVKTQKDMQK